MLHSVSSEAECKAGRSLRRWILAINGNTDCMLTSQRRLPCEAVGTAEG